MCIRDSVKKAYRKLSRQYHPDANINNPKKDEAEAKFKEVQQAYQQIMDCLLYTSILKTDTKFKSADEALASLKESVKKNPLLVLSAINALNNWDRCV